MTTKKIKNKEIERVVKFKDWFEYVMYCDENNLNQFHPYNLELLK